MSVTEFIKSLSDAPFDDAFTVTVFRSFVSELSNSDINEQEINAFLDTLKEQKWSELDTKLDRCLQECNAELKKAEALANQSYQEKLKIAEKIINDLSQYVTKKFAKRKKPYDSVSTAIEQHDDKLAEINNKITQLDDKVDSANKTIDNKFFNLLINTVSILGIFVAIAFAGISVTSIFPTIDINTALLSEEYLLKTIFYLLLVALLCYNLLLLLIYLIFKLSRPLFVSINRDKETQQNELEILKEGQFVKTINIVPFIWIDGGLTLLTLATFISVIVIW